MGKRYCQEETVSTNQHCTRHQFCFEGSEHSCSPGLKYTEELKPEEKQRGTVIREKASILGEKAKSLACLG